eukprot:CAMPEP_0197596820 /NCGR_PEP_ID=MMETSP1326-20131121/25926_1 /TAXON_ID=1155430 /ORGANISM="Genus nov. species nov., Strain RCC2288" /LENGTH=49 /DNA_ID= /DNA_START= /DNA_END= /DNA_ORIENTATION=
MSQRTLTPTVPPLQLTLSRVPVSLLETSPETTHSLEDRYRVEVTPTGTT